MWQHPAIHDNRITVVAKRLERALFSFRSHFTTIGVLSVHSTLSIWVLRNSELWKGGGVLPCGYDPSEVGVMTVLAEGAKSWRVWTRFGTCVERMDKIILDEFTLHTQFLTLTLPIIVTLTQPISCSRLSVLYSCVTERENWVFIYNLLCSFLKCFQFIHLLISFSKVFLIRVLAE